MFTKKTIIHTFSVCFIVMVLLIGVLPAQAKAIVSPLYTDSTFAWAKSIGGTNRDIGRSIAVDINGNVYTTGGFNGTADFNPAALTAADLTSAGVDDIFVSKLNIDGNYLWAKRMGGTNYDYGNSIVVDSEGAVYTTGYFQGTADFDPDALNTVNLTSAGGYDIFISKLDSDGNFVWVKNMGGAGDDYGYEIAVDLDGNVYITGSFSGTASFNPGDDTAELVSAGGDDIFVSKFDDSGNFVWAKRMGGTGADVGNSVITDASGVYSTGYFEVTADFDPGGSIVDLISAGDADIFVSKLDLDGNFAWAKSMGGDGGDNGFSIVVDSNDSIFTTGYFYNTADFDPEALTTGDLTSAGLADVFISKLDSDGNFLWAESIGGTDDDYGYDIAVDLSGSIYTIGFFYNFADFDPGLDVHYLGSVGEADIFVSKLDSDGSFDWATHMGGASGDVGYGVALDSDGGVYTTGYFQSNAADFDPGDGISYLSSAGGLDVFVSKFDEGNVLDGYKLYLPLVLKNSH